MWDISVLFLQFFCEFEIISRSLKFFKKLFYKVIFYIINIEEDIAQEWNIWILDIRGIPDYGSLQFG